MASTLDSVHPAVEENQPTPPQVEEYVFNNPRVEEIFQRFKNAQNTFAYNCSIKKVLEESKLMDWVQTKVKNDPKIINLVTKDWYSTLKNHIGFQEYMNGNVEFLKYESKLNKVISNYRVKSYQNNINLIVVGTFKITKDKETDETALKIKLVESIPLQCIAEVMCLSLEKNLMQNAKFFMKSCRGLCLTCRNNRVPIDNVWCVQRCMVYHDALHYAEREFCHASYPDEFKALVQLEISSAYTFGDRCKIGGSISYIIFIQNLFDANNEVQGILKKDVNFLPGAPPETQLDSLLQYAVPLAEQTVPEAPQMVPKIEVEEPPQEEEQVVGMKRKNEAENTPVKYLRSTDAGEENILAIPKGVQYAQPLERHYQVQSSLQTMPDQGERSAPPPSSLP